MASSEQLVDKGIDDLLALSSLFTTGTVDTDPLLASESRLIRSKLQRLFQHLLTNAQSEPVTQASGDQISSSEHVDDALLKLNRHATLKFRNYKHFREQVSRSKSRSKLLLVSPSFWPRPMNGGILLSHPKTFRLCGLAFGSQPLPCALNTIGGFDRKTSCGISCIGSFILRSLPGSSASRFVSTLSVWVSLRSTVHLAIPHRSSTSLR